MNTNKPRLVILKPRRIDPRTVLRLVSKRGQKVVVARLTRPDQPPTRPAA